MRRTALTLAIAAALAAVGTARAAGGPQEDLAACGAIADPTERLACYDRVAGRPATPAAPAAGAPKAAPQPVAPAQPSAAPAQAATPPAQVQGAAAAASFGAYQTEHPVVTQVPESLTARVSAMGKTIDGQPTVTLEGGALWLLDEVDPLLAVGDTITIKRGVFGSFLLETATRRVHHVRRIR
jgi:hypothetical protein